MIFLENLLRIENFTGEKRIVIVSGYIYSNNRNLLLRIFSEGQSVRLVRCFVSNSKEWSV